MKNDIFAEMVKDEISPKKVDKRHTLKSKFVFLLDDSFMCAVLTIQNSYSFYNIKRIKTITDDFYW